MRTLTCPRPSFKGVAYLASANFMARAITLLGDLVQSLFSYQRILLYGTHMDSNILLFFQAVFMIPVFLLGFLLFVGIEKESYNLVLYPTLTLLFVLILRYGTELALLIIHWSDHQFDQAPEVIYYLVVDLTFIAMLLLYVYFSLTAAPTRPTPGVHEVEAPEVEAMKMPQPPEEKKLIDSKRKKKKPPAPPPIDFDIPPPRPPLSPKFNYALRRNIGQLSSNSPEIALLDELDKQRQRNSGHLAEEDEGPHQQVILRTQSLKVYETEPVRRSLLIETDLDADENYEPEPPYVPIGIAESDEREPGGSEVKEVKQIDEGKEDAEESEYEYEYEEEEEGVEEEPEGDIVTLPRPKNLDGRDPKESEMKAEEYQPEPCTSTEDDDLIPTAAVAKLFKSTAV